jgi:uncharacterized protein YjdB
LRKDREIQTFIKGGAMKSTKGLMKRSLTIALCIFGVFFCSNVNAQKEQVANTQAPPLSVEYMAHAQNIGWMDWVKDGAIAGTTGRGLPMEAFKINVRKLPPNAHITYQAHVARWAWMDWIEAIKIKLENCPGWSVAYQVHVAGYGWTGWVNDGAIAGTTGQGRRIEAIKVKIQQIGSGAAGSTSGPLPAPQGSLSQSGSANSSSSQSVSPVYGPPTTGASTNTYTVTCAPKITINTQIDDIWVKKNFGATASSTNMNQVEVFVSGSYRGQDGFVSCHYKSSKGDILNLVYKFPCKNALPASPNSYSCAK